MLRGAGDEGGAFDFACVRRLDVSQAEWEEPSNGTVVTLADYAHRTMKFGAADSKVAFASIRPYGRWLYHHIPLRRGDVRWRTARPCHYSIFATSRANLHAHPRSFYESLASLFPDNATSVTEDAYFVEWSLDVLFGNRRLNEVAAKEWDE